MLSILLEESFWKSMSPLVLRIAVSFFFLYFGLRTLFKRRDKVTEYFKNSFYPGYKIIPWILGGSSLGTGVLIVFGAYTRWVSFVGIYIVLSLLYAQRKVKIFPYTRRFYLLLLAALFSLLFGGPGAFSFDFI